MHKQMTNLELAQLLRSVAAAYELHKPPFKNARFRILAYQKAADSIEHLTSEVCDLWENGQLEEIPGVGVSLQEHLNEIFSTGKSKHFHEMLEELPPAMFELMQVPGIGAKRAYKLSRELGITKAHGAIQKLAQAARKGKIRNLEGMGEQSELQILQTIAQVKNKSTRFLLPFAQTVADEVIEYMKKNPSVKKIDPLGSLRRQVSTIGDVDIAVASDNPKEVIAHFVAYPKKTKLIEAGERTAAILVAGGLHIDLMVQPPEAYGALLQHFTGSKEHNVALRTMMIKRGISISEYGLKRTISRADLRRPLEKFASEEKFYNALGMDWIPPELREDAGEIQAALQHKLPHLIEAKDLKGDLHLHSSFPPETSHDSGSSSMEEMVEEADRLGYEYIAFTEHNPKQEEVENKVMDVLKAKKERVDHINYSRGSSRENPSAGSGQGVKYVFNSLEVDIRPKGQLALPEKAYDLLDFVVAAVHSSFRGTKAEQTSRILAALDHPKVKIFAHPTGRKLNGREGVELDWDKIFDLCLKNQIWLEINSWPERLDLPDGLVREAIKAGVKLAINTDSHAADQMRLIKFGVSVARRGWATKGDIINTLPLNEFEKALNL